MLPSACHEADSVYEIQPGTLLQLLANAVVLGHTTPYLPPSALLSLAATSRAYRALLYGTPSVFGRLDLSAIGLAAVPISSLDRSGESFYSGPLRGVFSALGRAGWLAGVHTLLLDRVAVTAELVHEIITSPAYNVRILSLRHARHLDEHRLRRVLSLACRPGRPAGMPRLRGLYIIGGDETEDQKEDQDRTDDGDLWYRRRGRVLSGSAAVQAASWASTLMDCRGVLAFDAVLCHGPRHVTSPGPPAIAAHALDGCAGCGSAPEGWTAWGDESERTDVAGYVSRYPLLWPPPRLSSSIRAAMCPEGEPVHPLRHRLRPASPARFIARCDACIHDRMCFTCRRWWCESCMPDQIGGPSSKVGPDWISSSEHPDTCPADHARLLPLHIAVVNAAPAYVLPKVFPFSNGRPTYYSQCHECIAETQLWCRRCRTGYCTVHNVGSSPTHVRNTALVAVPEAAVWMARFSPVFRFYSEEANRGYIMDQQQPRVSLKSHY
ncbi:ubiquitin fusion degradation protein [Grosmannia clavigera kw1407]|uniref:Ubiquitin fusion degradation protein n=1 Tax=Grosmannia clavigera (strain kw1407 / UAMH 11150) TaxID=655863 RepID=F0XP69_GROCL|nr:ubiquitin fusion degradation protein [Grosmannia clavigera kw1407]EFX00490.1 ubiquitin fusion degradation protein [Grosmannia clavigera kw1407]